MAKKPTNATARDADEPQPTFEEAMASLEDIIDRIESGSIGLEDSVREYERGAKLVARARTLLDAAEQRVEELTDALGSDRGRGKAGGSGEIGSTGGASNADDPVD